MLFVFRCVFLFTISRSRHKILCWIMYEWKWSQIWKSKIGGPQTWWMVRVCLLICVHKFQSCLFSHMFPFSVGSHPFFKNQYHSRALSFFCVEQIFRVIKEKIMLKWKIVLNNYLYWQNTLLDNSNKFWYEQ